MKKKPKKPALEPRDGAAVAESVFSQALAAIDDEIRGLRNGTLKPGKYDTASRIAFLAKNAASFAGELRKARAADEKKRGSLSAQEIVARVREMEPNERAHVLAELGLVAEGKGLFG